MNRRQLLAALAGAAVAPGELWTPRKSIFLPPRGGWVGRRNRGLLTIDQIFAVMDTPLTRGELSIAYYGTVDLATGRVVDAYNAP